MTWAAAAQTPDSAAVQQQGAQAPAAPQGTQSQIDNPQTAAQAEEQKAQPANPADKKKPTAVEELEQKIRQYDPLAKEDEQRPSDKNGEKGNGKGNAKEGSAGDSRSGGSQAAGTALPGPSVGGGDGNADTSEYTGPAVLSRSYTLLRPQIPSQERWIPMLGLNGIYDSGLNGLPNVQGQANTGGSAGAEMIWGINGRHYFHHDIIGVDYRGDLQYYSPAKYFDGSNHWLNLDYSHAFSRHLSVNFVESGSIYSQNYALENPAAVSDQNGAPVNLSTTPNIQIFDNGYKQFTSSADVTWQRTARLSFDAGGSWFGVDRSASSLLGVTGYQGRADSMYRITRRTTLGVSYAYNTYSYPHGLGRADFHTLDVIYSWALTSSLQFRARGGVSRLNSSGLTALPLSPDLAALVGQSSVAVEYHSLQWVSDYSVQLVKDFRRGRSANIMYNRGLSPGNGLYLTSVTQDVAANGSLVLSRRYYASLGAGYDSLTAAAQYLGSYRAAFAFFGVSRSLRHGIQGNLRLDYRHYIISGAPLLQNEIRVTLGFSWSPTEGLFRLW
ncbi:MAG TPA: hypothetical protein VG345_14305 [Bryobacteraceae bacterium]|nr:hypothetical protein [Bryobacteraceae bacterium]